jgi:L-amino acid N-acyltransferase YncA
MSTVASQDRRSETAARGIIIRDAVEADVLAIVAIYNAAILTRIATAELEPVNTEKKLHWLIDHSPDDYPFWVAEIDGRVAG